MKVKTLLSLDEEIAVALKKLAQESHKTVSQWVTDKVYEAIKEEKEEKIDDKFTK